MSSSKQKMVVLSNEEGTIIPQYPAIAPQSLQPAPNLSQPAVNETELTQPHQEPPVPVHQMNLGNSTAGIELLDKDKVSRRNLKQSGEEVSAKGPDTEVKAGRPTKSIHSLATQGTRIVMGSDEDPREYDRLRLVFKRVLISGNVIGASMFFILFVWGLMYGGGYGWNTPAKAINLHIALMVFFLIYIQGHASLIYRILPNQPKYTVKLAHAGMHASVCVAMGVGLAAAVQSHNLKSSPHFYSLHSWLGITTIACYYLQFLGGFLTFLLPFSPVSFRNAVMPFHRFTGQSLFTFATGSAVTGVMLKAIGSLGDKYADLPPAGVLLNTAGFIVIIFAIVIGNLITDIRFRRRPRPEGEMLLSQTEGRGGGDADQSDQTD